MCRQTHLTRDFFSTYLTLRAHHVVAQGVAACVWQNHSCTCHHMFERLLFSCYVFFLSLSVYLWSKPPRTKTTALTHNEECCPVAIHNPLTRDARKEDATNTRTSRARTNGFCFRVATCCCRDHDLHQDHHSSNLSPICHPYPVWHKCVQLQRSFKQKHYLSWYVAALSLLGLVAAACDCHGRYDNKPPKN